MKLDQFRVGVELPALHIEPISRRSLALFAGGSNDHQAVHIDIDAAKARGRDDVIAHGMISMAYLGRFLTNLVPQERIRSFKTRFAAVTPVHAAPVCMGKVVSVEGGLAVIQMTVAIDDGRTITAQAEATIDLN